MKLLILSDLHLEFAPLPPPTVEVDVVILAGDISKGAQGIRWARANWPDTEIIFVGGNHEFYGEERNAVIESLRTAANDTGVHFLDNNEVVIKGIRFLGCTLWTNFHLYGWERQSECMGLGQQALNDFKLIKEGDGIFTPTDSVKLNQASVKWLELNLKHKTFKGDTVVVTHHCPSWESVAARYQKDLLSACFASRLESLLGFSKLWIHGHTHDSFDYTASGTRVICNPRGYVFNGKQENIKFNPLLTVEL
jgi:predicted phosphodiesterase